ncbi:MAG: GNAT family N-acetyltransferase [Thermoplasmata archaeon]
MRFEEIDWDDEARKNVQAFCEEAGLPASSTPWGKVVKIFVLRGSDGQIEASARIEMIYGRPFVESVAVRSDLRGRGLGREIVNHVLTKAKGLGYDKIWAIARVPEFYERLGFVKETDEELTTRQKKDCLSCEQYLKECHPLLMRKDII